MKSHALLTLAAFVSAAVFPLSAGAADYVVDPAHSQVLFKVKYLGISEVTGRFGEFSGEFGFDPTNPAASKVTASALAASIDTGVDDRDNHLRSADFFEAETYPELKFVSTKVTDVSDKQFKLHGDLTIRGVTKPVVFDVTVNGVAQDPWGNTKSAFVATAEIDRREFGLTWNKALEAGGLLVSNEVRISLVIAGIQKKDAN